jgi:hypothetical protein
VRDAVDLLFSVNVLPHITVRHYVASTDVVEARAARHGIRKLIEYVENGAPNSGFDPDNDTMVSNYTLWNKVWSVLDVTTLTVNGASVVKVCSHTAVVEVCTYFTNIGADLSVNGSAFHVDNNAVHHTLRIMNFPYTQTGTRLAVKVHYESRTIVQDMTSGTSVGEAGTVLVGNSGDTIQPVAAWATSVTLSGGTSCPATAMVARDIYRDVESVKDIDNAPNLPSETTITLKEHFTYFSFLTTCQPAGIYWDPDIGVQDDSTASASSVSYIALLLIASIAMLL